jgi:formylglycine-generating enzyme required for sulfatase activity/tRNA A-37 threonylcarbamoyl transferase component Bud32
MFWKKDASAEGERGAPPPAEGTVSVPPQAPLAPAESPSQGGGTISLPPAAPPAESPSQGGGTVSLGPGGAPGGPDHATWTGTEPPPRAPAPPRPAPIPAPTPSAGALAVGRRFGPYQLLAELGRGGMGVVYKALHVALNREVALKLMLAQEVTDEDRTRFLREAESSAALKHPYIVAVHDVGVEEGKLFFSMDFIAGKTFKKVIEEQRADLPLVLGIFMKVCEGVGAAHRLGIIHRDLKPQNVMVDADMNPHIMDFGLARRVNEPERPDADAKRRARLTKMGSVMGTPVYMPPEQAGGRVDKVDTRSDIYSLGVILYAILTGDLPFRASSTPELLLKIESEPPVPPRAKNPGCPWELERVILRAIEKDQDRRYQSAFELRDEVAAWLAGRPVAAAEGGALYRARKLVVRKRGTVALASAAVLAIAAGGAIALRQAGAAQRERVARAAALVEEAKGDLARGEALRHRLEGADGKLAADAMRATLDEAEKLYAGALERLTAARHLDETSMAAMSAAGEAALGEQAVKTLGEALIERETRLAAAREAREAARTLAEAAAARLASLDPFAARDLASVTAAKADVGAARDDFVKAIAFDKESKLAYDGLSTTVVQKLAALGDREKLFAAAARLDALAAEIDAALAAADGASGDAARAQIRRAIAAFAEALRIDPKNPARFAEAVRIGTRALAARQVDLAEHVADEVRDMGDPAVAKFVDDVKRARDDEGRFTKALETGEVALAAEDWKRAASAYQEALVAAPGRPAAEFGLRFARGGAAAREGRHEEALAVYEEARPFAARALDQGALDRAVAHERAAIAAEAVLAAEAAVKAGRFDDAKRELARALAARPDDPAALRLRGEVEARASVPPGTLLVPEGPFTLGTGAAAREAVPCKAFFIGTTEVTNRDFLEFVKDGGYEKKDLWDAEAWEARGELVGQDGKAGPLGWTGGKPPAGKDDLPVAGVSWYEARAFARWKGPGWRLPSDAEWEKAATWDTTAGAKMELPWLTRAPGAAAASTWQEVWRPYFNRQEPKPVGAPFGKNAGGAPLFDRSPSGALDMWGNVRELVVARGDGEKELAAVRGGSFASRVEERSTAYINYRPTPTYRALDVGFRLAKPAQ